jgi:hypothetical protein
MKYLRIFDRMDSPTDAWMGAIVPISSVLNFNFGNYCNADAVFISTRDHHHGLMFTPSVEKGKYNLQVFLTELIRIIRNAPDWTIVKGYDENGEWDIVLEE